MTKIPHERLIIYLFILGLLPLVLIYGSYTAKKELQTSLLYELSSSCLETETRNQKELHNRLTRSAFQNQNKDPMYLNKEVESIALLTNEREQIQKVATCGFNPDEENLRRRLTFLTGGENALSFTQHPEKRYASFHETLFTLARPVDVDTSDIRKILSKIEGVEIGDEKVNNLRPQLIITEFRIEKKPSPLNEVFSLNLKLIKREYAQKK